MSAHLDTTQALLLMGTFCASQVYKMNGLDSQGGDINAFMHRKASQ